MEELYNEVYDYLQECVNSDVYTEDEANEILSVAYNRYILESEESKESPKKINKKIASIGASAATAITLGTAISVTCANMIKAKKGYENNEILKTLKLQVRDVLKKLMNIQNDCKDDIKVAKKYASDYKSLSNQQKMKYNTSVAMGSYDTMYITTKNNSYDPIQSKENLKISKEYKQQSVDLKNKKKEIKNCIKELKVIAKQLDKLARNNDVDIDKIGNIADKLNDLEMKIDNI